MAPGIWRSTLQIGIPIFFANDSDAIARGVVIDGFSIGFGTAGEINVLAEGRFNNLRSMLDLEAE